MNTAKKLGPDTHTLGTQTPDLGSGTLLVGDRGMHKKIECRAAVVNKHTCDPRHRPRPLPATPLVVRRRYLAVLPRPLPAAPLAVCLKYLIVVPRNLAVRRRYLIVMPRPMPAAPRRNLIVVSGPLPAAPLVVRRRYLIVAPGRWPRQRAGN